MRVVRYYPRALVGDGGMTSAVKRWSQGMVNRGAEAVIAFDEGVDPPADGGVQWMPVRHAGRRGLKVPVGLEDILRGADVLVLHSGWTLRNIRAAAVARKLNVPYVLEPRGAYDPHIVHRKRATKKAWWAAWEKELVDKAGAIHIFFEPEREHLRALGYEGPVITVSNGVDVPDGAWKDDNDAYLLWLGRFDPEHKGLDLLLQAVRSLAPDDRPQLRLLGPDWRARKQRVSKWVADMQLSGSVAVGEGVYGSAKRKMLVEAAGFVYPSRWDACPNSVLESVSLGIPTLATPYPLAQHLGDKGGALVATASASGLAEGLVKLRSPEAAATGARGAEIVRRELTWDQVAEQWLQQAKAIL